MKENNVILQDRLLRVNQVLEIIPVSKSSWWAGVKSGRYPQPVKLGPNTTAWRWQDIQTLTKHGITAEWHSIGTLELEGTDNDL